MEDAGIDLKKADIQVKEATVEHVQSQALPVGGRIDGHAVQIDTHGEKREPIQKRNPFVRGIYSRRQ